MKSGKCPRAPRKQKIRDKGKAMKEVILKTDLESLRLFKRGKVRDIYELENCEAC